ncbi:hypothetical protein E5288_WYG006498 [Bos mutus]|uniref:Uncharacterized protein n=1 Tax=Bos mutus TaxID=72004 RepID=A0A6B0R7U3_9CETA|nr:hypothetical protein [Bos mutus]
MLSPLHPSPETRDHEMLRTSGQEDKTPGTSSLKLNVITLVICKAIQHLKIAAPSCSLLSRSHFFPDIKCVQAPFGFSLCHVEEEEKEETELMNLATCSALIGLVTVASPWGLTTRCFTLSLDLHGELLRSAKHMLMWLNVVPPVFQDDQEAGFQCRYVAHVKGSDNWDHQTTLPLSV